MEAMERLHKQFPNDDEVTTFYALSMLSAARATDDSTYRPEMKAGALAMQVFRRNPNHPGATHYIIHAFDDPVHAPLALEAAFAYAKIVPAVSHAVHMPTHIFIQHGMWNEVAHQNVRAFGIAKDLWQPGDSPGDMAHSGDWGQYRFLQLGDYGGARERIKAFEEMAEVTKQARATSALTLVRARYIVETEEWNVQAIPDTASGSTVFANGLSAVSTRDHATAEKMLARLATIAKVPAAPAGGAHADHRASPAAPAAAAGLSEGDKASRIMHHELAARIAESKGQRDQAIALLKQAVEIEESMLRQTARLIRSNPRTSSSARGRPSRATRRSCRGLRRLSSPHAEPRAIPPRRRQGLRGGWQSGRRSRTLGEAAVVLEGHAAPRARSRPVAKRAARRGRGGGGGGRETGRQPRESGWVGSVAGGRQAAGVFIWYVGFFFGWFGLADCALRYRYDGYIRSMVRRPRRT